MKQVVAIDGPSGAGKSTVARELARRLGYIHLDTGAMYRAVALAAVRARIALDDNNALDELCREIDIGLVNSPQGLRVTLQGEDVTLQIRTPEMSSASSAVSSVSEVRRHLVRLQRKIGSGGGVVAEGRDVGTVVFPETEAKFYLDATIEERAQRRWLELKDRDIEESQESVLNDIKTRDHNDSTRDDSPLQRADDSIVIDTTSKTPEDVVEEILLVVKELEAGCG
ncbi:(d)CMP kinase [bacterium]|nr:MAG: (d)CMP kinase [bacterium]